MLLIVWDTVRADNLSTYGYVRDTSPHLTDWAAKGVRYQARAGAGPLDLSFAYMLLHRPVATQAQHSVEIPSRYPRPDAGRVPGLAGLSDRRFRGQYQLLHL